MSNYSKAKIYKIVNDNIPNKVYYGSTCSSLSRRLYQHKSFNNKCTSRILLEKEGYKIILVEWYPCNNKDELKKKERWYIENNECVNKHIPGRTYKEYYETNKEHLDKKRKEWHLKNKERVKKNTLDYYQKNKEVIKKRMKEWVIENEARYKERKKEYYLKNKETMNKQKKKYYIKNKEIVTEKIGCRICKCMITKHHFARHKKTKKHIENSK